LFYRKICVVYHTYCMVQKVIALFGGTFDPIHRGHVAVAAAAGEKIAAEKVVFVPARRSPLKTICPLAADNDRMNMIALAIAGQKNFEVSDYELKKQKPCYTIETVEYFQSEYGSDASIYWLLGADGIDELPYWYKIGELIDVCNLAVMFRGGCEPPDFSRLKAVLGPDRADKLRRNVIQTPLIDVSSTEIRRRLAAGLDVSDMLLPVVTEYIYQRGLYGAKVKS